MYRRGGTGFLLGYVLVSFVSALVDIARGVFYVIGLTLQVVFRLIGLGFDLTGRTSFDKEINTAVAPYLQVLISKRQKLLRANDYGVIDSGPWSKEVGHFLGHVLLPKLGRYEGCARRNLPYTANLVDSIVSEHQPLPRA